MKQEYTKYTCDHCQKDRTITHGTYGRVLGSWIRLYIMISPAHTTKTKLHFCSKECVIAKMEELGK